MKRLDFLALIGLLQGLALALELFERNSASSVVALRIEKAEGGAPKNGVRRRTTSISEPLSNERLCYLANISLGTPQQEIRVQIDTGSSDLWVPSATSFLCAHDGLDACSTLGSFDANSSSSYTYLNSDFEVYYVDLDHSAGDYASETIHLGGQTLTGLQIGIGYASRALGVLGIGYQINEAQVDWFDDSAKPYPNLGQLMVDQGLIQSNAYSLWLDDLQSNTGVILFGGVDSDKYHGTLQTLPVQRWNDNRYAELRIAFNGLSVSSDGRGQLFQSNFSMTALLDSGSTMNYLPEKLANDLFYALSIDDGQQGPKRIDCRSADSNASLDFLFSSVKITVPMRELVLQAKDFEELNDAADARSCVFGILPTPGTNAQLGDTFLRSAYVVYDLSNNEISLAQTNFDATTSHILEIGKGIDAVPNASIVATPMKATTQVHSIPLPSGGPEAIGQAEAANAENVAAVRFARYHPTLFALGGAAFVFTLA